MTRGGSSRRGGYSRFSRSVPRAARYASYANVVPSLAQLLDPAILGPNFPNACRRALIPSPMSRLTVTMSIARIVTRPCFSRFDDGGLSGRGHRLPRSRHGCRRHRPPRAPLDYSRDERRRLPQVFHRPAHHCRWARSDEWRSGPAITIVDGCAPGSTLAQATGHCHQGQ